MHASKSVSHSMSPFSLSLLSDVSPGKEPDNAVLPRRRELQHLLSITGWSR